MELAEKFTLSRVIRKTSSLSVKLYPTESTSRLTELSTEKYDKKKTKLLKNFNQDLIAKRYIWFNCTRNVIYL